MVFEQKDMSGILFRAEKKQERSPDYSGNITINGHRYRLAAWIKEGKKGKFMSLAVSDPSGYQQRIQQEDNNIRQQELDDKIPF